MITVVVTVVVTVLSQVVAAVVSRFVIDAVLRRDRAARRVNPGGDVAGGAGVVQRPAARRGYRTPLTQPSRSYGASLPERLAESMRLCGRTPVERGRHRWRVMELWRAARQALLPVKTLPKSAFTIIDWRLRPMADTELAARQPYCGGFEFCVRVHGGENRRHLQRSLKTGRARARSRRLIAVASARDMFEPVSWVRCLVVNADTLQLPADDPGHAVLCSAEPSARDGPLAYRSRQQDVPEDAVWLVVPTSNYRSPSARWGQMCESHHQQTSVAVGTVPQGCDDIDNEGYVRRWVRSYRMATVWLWAMLGPVTWLLLWLYGLLAALPAEDRSTAATFATALSVHAVVYLLAVFVALLKLAAETGRATYWRCRENQTRRSDRPHRAWTGGTDECLIAGDLLRRGPNLRRRQWRAHCAAAVQDQL